MNTAPLFPYKLDEFQLKAIEHLQAGKNVVVCAPTGAGKTAIAEYAVAMAVQSGKRCYYTTPLKALSNQKLHDFQQLYGQDQVGLLTGDTSINRDAPVVVMTTEVFRNMLYGTIFGEVQRNLENVAFVVLDECHYMNDAERGTVWEESIIYAPKTLQLIALSATVANAGELTSWIDETHGPTALIASDYRPVPLRFYYFGGKKLYPLLDTNRHLQPQLRGRFQKHKYGQHKPKGLEGQPVHPADVIWTLADRQMLPAIYFVFSRRGCEQAMRHCSELSLLNPAEEKRLEEVIEKYFSENTSSGLADHPHMQYLVNGIAVHHAGMLPSWKGLVEKLFQQNLLKVVFATETLAAGINMPARTTVVSSIEKRADEGHRQLKASEFLQMSGRAGRRGMDEIGHVVVLHNPFQSAEEAARLAVAPADPLVSRFTPSYGMVLNLLDTHTPEQARELIEASFGQYLVNQNLGPSYEERMKLEIELDEAMKNETAKSAQRVTKIKERLLFLNKTIARQTTQYWRGFEALSNILNVSGYINSNKPTELGRLAQGVRGTNELFLSEVFISGTLETLAVDELSAVLTALVTEPSRYEERWRGKGSHDLLTPQIEYAMSQIAKVARQVGKWQRQFNVDVPIQFGPSFCYFSQQWAQGITWDELAKIAQARRVDEGDVVRSLRRTLDLCRQIKRAPNMNEHLVQLCHQTEKLLARDEISEEA